MAADSLISWTKHTFNPWRGCSKVHEGCTHCYAEKAMPNVMRKGGPLKWGEVWQGGERVVASEAMWKEPLRWARAAAAVGERHRVFCASLADVLEEPEMPPFARLTTDLRETVNSVRARLHGARERLWDVIRQTAADGVAEPLLANWRSMPGLDWLLLTKRPENWRLVPEDVRPLVWLGTSVSSQETVEEWGPRLLGAEGFRYRFLSVEPLVGPVDLSAVLLRGVDDVVGGIDWVIVGGESGAKARPCNVEWIRSIIKQCAEAEVPCFVKQLGAEVRSAGFCRDCADHGPICPHSGLPCGGLKDPKGGDWTEWPEDLRVRRFPEGVCP